MHGETNFLLRQISKRINSICVHKKAQECSKVQPGITKCIQWAFQHSKATHVHKHSHHKRDLVESNGRNQRKITPFLRIQKLPEFCWLGWLKCSFQSNCLFPSTACNPFRVISGIRRKCSLVGLLTPTLVYNMRWALLGLDSDFNFDNSENKTMPYKSVLQDKASIWTHSSRFTNYGLYISASRMKPPTKPKITLTLLFFTKLISKLHIWTLGFIFGMTCDIYIPAEKGVKNAAL